MVDNSDTRQIFFVRHGNTFESNEPARFVGSKSDPLLTLAGREQAKRVASYLKEINFIPEVILSGPRKRQLESAQIVCNALSSVSNISPIIEPLFEEISYGSWEGLTQDEIMSCWPDEFKAWQERDIWPEGIFLSLKSDLVNNIDKWISKLADQDYPYNKILVFTSNGILRIIYELLQVHKISNSSKVKTGHICGIALIEQSFRPIFWNFEPSSVG